MLSAWKEVGIRISGVQALAAATSRMRYQPTAEIGNGHHEDQAEVDRARSSSSPSQLATLSKQVAGLRSQAALVIVSAEREHRLKS